jgi:adenine-specific DNA-methyltransferase
MMRDRLERAYELLAEDGVLLTAIDDTETAHLRLLLDEVFGPANHVTTLAVEVNPAGQNLRPNVPARSHEYWHVYARDASRVRVRPRPLTPAEEAVYTEEDAKGRFLWDNLRRRGGNSRPEDRPNQWFPLFVDLAKGMVSVEPFPGAEEVWPIDPRGERRIWRVSPEGARREIAAGEIGVLRRGGRIEVVKKSRRPPGRKPKTLWKAPAYSATTYGTKLLEQIVATNVFTYPKSLHLVRDLLAAWAGPEATVLDFFAGSGTTAHAVLDLNRRDGGRRKYLLVEGGDHFDTVLRPRLMKVIYCPEWRHRRPLRRDAGTSHVFRYQRLGPFEVPRSGSCR